MKETRPNQLQRYDQLRAAAARLAGLGQFRKGLALLEEALEIAQLVGPEDLVERARINRARLALELSPADKEPVQELGRILLRSQDPENGYRAALNLTRAYLLRKEQGRSLFYARIACEKAAMTGSPGFCAVAKNEFGLCLLAASYFDQAVAEFEAALSLFPKDDEELSQRRAAALDNLGYAYVVLGRPKEGFRSLYEALRTIRGLDSAWLEMNIRLSLSFSFLEVGKPKAALRHGHAALAIADSSDDTDAMKAALFLLGEAAKQVGEEFSARRYFSRLQETFYPSAPDLTDLLLMIDARTLVNLKA